jgi:MFS family permease
MTQPADARPGGTPALAGAAVPDHRWLILGVIALAQLMIVLDATVMNIALPTAQRDLGFSIVDRQWVVTAYALAFGSLRPVPLHGLSAVDAMASRWGVEPLGHTGKVIWAELRR